MKTSDFNYDLPEKLIANYPLDERSSSRLLVYSDQVDHRKFRDVINYFEEGDLLVVNNTSVIPARFFIAIDSSWNHRGIISKKVTPW